MNSDQNFNQDEDKKLRKLAAFALIRSRDLERIVVWLCSGDLKLSDINDDDLPGLLTQLEREEQLAVNPTWKSMLKRLVSETVAEVASRELSR